MRDASVLPLFVLTALALALTAGFGLGLWLLLARTAGVSTFGVPWIALVQVHGTIQLVGFALMFVMGVGLQVLPRFRGAPPPPRPLLALAFAPTVLGICLRAVGQPAIALPGRDAVLALSSALLVLGTTAFAVAALRALRSGTHAHRSDELLIAAGVAASPIATLLVALAMPFPDSPVVVDLAAEDRAVWMMLLGCLGTTIVGVWARLAPGFVASPPADARRLIAGGAIWMVGVLGLVAAVPMAGAIVLAGIAVLTWTLGVFRASIARQPLAGHARLTRFAVRSAFAWALVGAALLAWQDARATLGMTPAYLERSAVRHAFALGFVTLMIYGVAARALPSLLERHVWSDGLQLAVLVLADLGVALRVVPQVIASDTPVARALVAASGVLAYLALVLFSLNVVRMLRAPVVARSAPRVMPIAVRFPPKT